MRPNTCVRILAAACALAALAAPSPADELRDAIDRAVRAAEPKVIAWRRDLHQHPELGNREVRTAALVAKQLKRLGLSVRTGVAHTGVVAVLRGAAERPVVALRADMDALPLTEETGLSFASRVRTTYLGQEVGVMHACGHDAHTAILLGVAEALASVRQSLPGTVLFVFQPAEEGPPPGERGGASLLLEEGAFADPAPDAIFGLHVSPFQNTGEIGLVSGAAMASSDRLTVRVIGRGAHAAYPWKAVDPIPVAAQITLALESLPARQVDARIPSVVSIGSVHGGVRYNIIPDQVELAGTIRALGPEVRAQLHERVRRTARGIAESAGASAEVRIDDGNPITWNDPDLARRARPTLERVAGRERVVEPLPWTGAEDFSRYQERVPGVFLFLGVVPAGTDPAAAEPNHTPRFQLDEAALELGVRALAQLAVDTLTAPR
jgi:amidohydrolase